MIQTIIVFQNAQQENILKKLIVNYVIKKTAIRNCQINARSVYKTVNFVTLQTRVMNATLDIIYKANNVLKHVIKVMSQKWEDFANLVKENHHIQIV